MKKIKSLNCYQKGVLIFMITMVLVFAVVYPVTISRVGFEYEHTILVLSQENGNMVYSGKIQGQHACFTVSEDKTVVFQYGNKTYGPYTAKEDPTAIPKDNEMAEFMVGVELRQGEDILFRGGMMYWVGGGYRLYNEDGTLDNLGLFYSTILELMDGPKLTHKGEWSAWFGAVFLCIFNALFILFADELFRWNLAFRIRNADHAEPSDWEVAERYIVWTALTIMALAFFIIGLQ